MAGLDLSSAAGFQKGADSGVLVAGSRRADFPTEGDRLLLKVGANQAAGVYAGSFNVTVAYN